MGSETSTISSKSSEGRRTAAISSAAGGRGPRRYYGLDHEPRPGVLERPDVRWSAHVPLRRRRDVYGTSWICPTRSSTSGYATPTSSRRRRNQPQVPRRDLRGALDYDNIFTNLSSTFSGTYESPCRRQGWSNVPSRARYQERRDGVWFDPAEALRLSTRVEISMKSDAPRRGPRKANLLFALDARVLPRAGA